MYLNRVAVISLRDSHLFRQISSALSVLKKVSTTRALQNVMLVLPSEEMVALQWADITLSKALG
jgi:hypothetical protein